MREPESDLVREPEGELDVGTPTDPERDTDTHSEHDDTAGGDLFVDLTSYPVDREVVKMISPRLARRCQAIPLRREAGRIVVALANPSDLFVIDDLRAALRSPVKVLATTTASLEWAMSEWLHMGAEADSLVRLAEAETASSGRHPEDQGVKAVTEAPLVRLVDLVLADAVRVGASDIHLEPTRAEFQVRHRVDGVLRESRGFPRTVQAALISRIKLMAGLDIAERRLPQDGRIRKSIEGRMLDLRVAVLPTVHGEQVIIRILDNEMGVGSLDDVGFLPEVLRKYEALARRPHGALLVTGPTGSGKSTTLYATLSTVNDRSKKIITVEDPVEYETAGISQVQVHPRSGLTFARALRSILRCDPDVVLVGEIRDRETALIALEAALTGHLVLSTLHTNDAVSTPLRLIELGVEPYLVASGLEGVVGQRLVRLLCPRCKEPAPADDPEIGKHYRAVGCRECGHSGYRGRRGIQELMVVSTAIEQLIAAAAAPEEIERIALEEGMVPLRNAGLELVKQGLTTVEEVLRVTA